MNKNLEKSVNDELSQNNTPSIDFDDIDHKEIVLFEISASLNSFKEALNGEDKNSLNLVSEMQALLLQLEHSALIA